MPFKIVMTIENNKPQLCICPSQWERDGLLKWPKKCSEKLMKDENAAAKSDWRQINCLVKRKNLLSYEAADEELQIMLENTDTEHEDAQIRQVTFRHPQQRPEPVNFNNLANQLIVQQAEESVNSSTSTLTAQTESGETYHIVVPENPAPETSISSESDNNTLKLILHNQSVLFELNNTILENQRKMMHELASLSVQMEESFSKSNDRSNVKTLNGCLGATENESFTIKQIKNVQDLEYMELMLSDNEQKRKLINVSSFICSGGQGTAKNCAFRFVDVLFLRDFLCKCSWSGSSRSDGVKVSLKCYKKTLIFFYEMIKHWDTSYTLEENEKFFKDILKNSNKRMNVKYERISTKRRRTNQKDKLKEQRRANDFEEVMKKNGFGSILAENTKDPKHSNNESQKNNYSYENDKEDDQPEYEESLC